MTDQTDYEAQLQAWAKGGGGGIPRHGPTPAVGQVWMAPNSVLQIQQKPQEEHPVIVIPPEPNPTSVTVFEASSHRNYPQPYGVLTEGDVTPAAGRSRGLRLSTLVNLRRAYSVPPGALREMLGVVDSRVLQGLLEQHYAYLAAQRPRLGP